MPSFAQLSNEFLDAEFADSPVRASGLGLTEYDDRLDDLSEAAYDRRRAADATWLGRFRALEDADLREAFLAAHGSSDTDALRAFHDRITSSGGLPIALAERAVLATAAR